MGGLDCSGLVQILVRAAGEDPPGDQSAQALYNHFILHGTTNVWGPGALVFYGKDSSKISHVGFAVSNFQMIEAGGGDSTCVNIDAAKAKNAFVRLSLIKGRPDFISIIRPQYSKIGMI